MVLLTGEHPIHNGDFKFMPRIGEKFVVNPQNESDEQWAKIYEVVDVHYTFDGGADVFVRLLGDYTKYMTALIAEVKAQGDKS